MSTRAELAAKLSELGATAPRPGINWTWVSFPTADNAKAFIEWMDAQGDFDHRGIYGPSDRDPLWSVRYR